MKNNLGLKIVALLMAVFIWLQITLVSQHQSKIGLNLKLVNAAGPDSLRTPPGKIPITVNGRGLDVMRLKMSKAYIQMEAADYWAGNSSDFIAMGIPENLNVKLLGIAPPTLAEQIKAREQTPTNDEPAPGVETKPVESGIESKPAKDRSDPSEQIQTRVLTDLPIVAPPGRTTFPAKATLMVRGKSSLLEKLPAGVRISALVQSDFRGQLSLKAELPEGVTLIDITPKQVRASR